MADDENVIVLSSDTEEDNDQESQEQTEPEGKEEKLNLAELLNTPVKFFYLIMKYLKNLNRDFN